MHRVLLAAAGFLLLTPLLGAQMAGVPPQNAGAPPQTAGALPAATAHAPRRQPPRPAKDAAPGGGPDKVWVNLNSSTYHCFGDRYYGKTANGRYMTEAAAKAAGAHGAGNRTCAAK